MDEENTSEVIPSHKNSAEVIDDEYDDNGINFFDTEEEADVTSIKSINATNNISMNDDDNFIHKYYAPFLSSNKYEDVSSGSEYFQLNK